MSTSIIERADAEHQNPVRRAAPADLIRTIDGVHAPAAGAWEIGRGQNIRLTARGLRTRSVPTRVAHGTLVVTDELLGSSLDFTVLVPDTGSYVGFSTRVSRLLSVECWQGAGTVTTAGGSCPVSLSLRYNGVFCQRGRPPSLWLTIQATIVLPEMSVAVVGRRVRRLKIAAELNLNPRGQLPSPGASPSHCRFDGASASRRSSDDLGVTSEEVPDSPVVNREALRWSFQSADPCGPRST